MAVTLPPRHFYLFAKEVNSRKRLKSFLWEKVLLLSPLVYLTTGAHTIHQLMQMRKKQRQIKIHAVTEREAKQREPTLKP